MDGIHQINIEDWIKRTAQFSVSDVLYFDSYHIDELLKCTKKEWLEKSFETYELIDSIIKQAGYSISCALVIVLNRKRKSNVLVSKIDYTEINKQITPPEIYLIGSKNRSFWSDITSDSTKVKIL